MPYLKIKTTFANFLSRYWFLFPISYSVLDKGIETSQKEPLYIGSADRDANTEYSSIPRVPVESFSQFRDALERD